MTPRRSQAESRAQTRAKLISAAASVVGRVGADRARVEDIAAEAGLTTGAIYYNFDGKDGLLLALAEHVGAVEQPLFPDEVGALPVRDRIDAWAKGVGEWLEREPWIVALQGELHRYAMRHPAMREQVIEHLHRDWERNGAFFAGVLRELGVTPPADERRLGILGTSLLMGLFEARLVAGAANVPDDVFTSAMRLLAAGAPGLGAGA